MATVTAPIILDSTGQDIVTQLTRLANQTVYTGGDGININNQNVISTNVASTSQLGAVKVDGTTVTIDGNGVISSAGGVSYSAGDGIDISNHVISNSASIVTTLQVSTTGWISDTTSQSGTTLYKKSVSLNHVYKDCPDISIGAAAGLPSTAEQAAYDLLKYVTVDDTVPCLYLYASAIPTNGFYINAEGCD